MSFNAPIQTKICKFDSYFNQNRQTSNCYMNYIQQKSSRFDICPVDMVSGYGDLSAMFGMLWRKVIHPIMKTKILSKKVKNGMLWRNLVVKKAKVMMTKVVMMEMINPCRFLNHCKGYLLHRM